MARQCIFCGSDNLSNEHIFPQWLLKALDAKKKKMASRHVSFIGFQKSERPLTLNKFVNGLVCLECNNNWLSELEMAVKPLLLKLIQGEVSKEELDELIKNRKVVAIWAFKTAIILNRATNFHNIVPRRHFRLFYKTKRIPENVNVSISFSEKEDIDWIQTQTVIHVGTNTEGISKNPRFKDLYNISLQLGRLLFKVVYSPFYSYTYEPGENEIVIHPNVNVSSSGTFEYQSLTGLSIGGTYVE